MLDEHGVDMQVVTLTTPGTHVEEPDVAVRLASLVNDEFKEAMDARGQHFTALATLPLNDPAAAAKELDRALTQLGMPGRDAVQQRQRRRAERPAVLADLRSGESSTAPCSTSTRSIR